MLLNENHGSFGMFSRAGRNSAEKYNILVRKDEILGGVNRKRAHKDIFTPDEPIKHQEEEDDVDIFKKEKSEKTDRIGISDANGHKSRKKKPKSEITKYLEMRKKTKSKAENPACTKYNPKNQFVWKKILTGPKWDQSIRKTFSKVAREEVDLPFYNTHTEFKVEGKNFVDLARQIRRASFSSNRNIKRKDSKFSMENNGNGKTSNSFYSKTIKSTGNNMNTYTTGDSEMNETNYKTKGKTGLLNKSNLKDGSSTNRWVKLQAPDFKKIISRDQLEKIYGDKRTIIPFSFPNYKWTRPRPIMMVKYDQTVHAKHRDERPKTEYFDVNYDPHKALNFVNNNKKPNTLNFDKMTSRPSTNDPLPCYLKNIHTRQSAEMMTEKALKMNNFSEGKFSSTATCFWPKKSFNKIINLNLLNSTKFKDDVGINTDNDEPTKSNEMNDYIQKSMKFYNKNYDDLIKESMLNKFDNVTYKSIKRENKLETGDFEKFLINFEKVDA